MADVVTGNQQWDFPADQIPVPLKNKQVKECHLEILNIGYGANHAILRLVFKHPQKAASTYAPAGTRGLIINLAVNGPVAAAPAIAGEFEVQTFVYEGQHERAAFTHELPIKGKRTVNRFLRVLESAKLLPCSFSFVHPDAVGCRDFTSQYIYHLDAANVLKLPDDKATSVYDLFNFRYPAGGGAKVASQVPAAVFGNPDFVHTRIAGVDYR